MLIAASGSIEGEPGTFVDLYRVADNKIVEHWAFRKNCNPHQIFVEPGGRTGARTARVRGLIIRRIWQTMVGATAAIMLATIFLKRFHIRSGRAGLRECCISPA